MKWKNRVLTGLLFVTVALVYIHLVWTVNRTPLSPTPYAYLNYLLSAFIHGRVYMTPITTYDLSLFQNKWYAYWGPAPVLFIFPFYIFTKLKTSDILYTLIAGILNCYIFYFALKELILFFRLKVSNWSRYFLLLCFAFASPNYYLSMNGKIWETGQIIATFYILTSLLFFFKFLNNVNKKKFIILSLLFFNLAWLSRYTLLFHVLLYIYPLVYLYRSGRERRLKTTLKIILTSIIIGCGVFFIYNFLRFGSIFETGIHYQTANQRFIEDIKTGQIFSFKNIAHNFTYYFLNHIQVSFERPYIHMDIEGNSVFSVYPLLLLIMSIFQFKSFTNKRVSLYLFFTSLVVLITLSLLMLTLGTGWIQFGNRYFFDVIPLLFLSGAFIINLTPALVKFLALIYGIAVNTAGILVFYNKL